ncbi:hypothetical protein RB628_33720 [Streptomyces sp. ADMS]|uniref:hypothetical protein n=1 Tax=Streptomyces sp. ADMS TaxID=3071415 RepID=UPI00296FBC91|nr:hypothetical protein [Streptomyces sp. ADMS]MDW4910158.1 hypothetical protein [Streptomyces sp. ADMS]
MVDPTARVSTGGSTIVPYAVVCAHALVGRPVIGGNVAVDEAAQIHESSWTTTPRPAANRYRARP